MCEGSETLLAASSRNRSGLSNAYCKSVCSRPNSACISILARDLWTNFNVEFNLSPTSNTRYWSCAFFKLQTLDSGSGLCCAFVRTESWLGFRSCRICDPAELVAQLVALVVSVPPGFLVGAVVELAFDPCCHTPGGGRGPLKIVLHTASDNCLPTPTSSSCLWSVVTHKLHNKPNKTWEPILFDVFCYVHTTICFFSRALSHDVLHSPCVSSRTSHTLRTRHRADTRRTWWRSAVESFSSVPCCGAR